MNEVDPFNFSLLRTCIFPTQSSSTPILPTFFFSWLTLFQLFSLFFLSSSMVPSLLTFFWYFLFLHATSLHFVCRSCLLWPIFSLLENMVGLKVVIQMSGHNFFFFLMKLNLTTSLVTMRRFLLHGIVPPLKPTLLIFPLNRIFGLAMWLVSF